MKKLFEEPWLDVVCIKNFDVLTASPDDQDYGSVDSDTEVSVEP